MEYRATAWIFVRLRGGVLARAGRGSMLNACVGGHDTTGAASCNGVAGRGGWIWVAVPCDSVDFNNDGSFFDPIDIDVFLSTNSGGPCIPEIAACNDIDFNNDGSWYDPSDIASFLSVYAEGPCL